MKFAAHPVNVEAGGGGAMRVSVSLADAPAAGSSPSYALWAARLPQPLEPVSLNALACGTFDISNLAIRQDSSLAGLRQAQSIDVKQVGSKVTIEGSLFIETTDMPPRTTTGPSWDVITHPLKERSDGPWLLAVTACLPDNSVVIAKGGLNQWAGQEHLAGVVLSPSNLAPEVELGNWLEATIRSLKPVLDFRMAQVSSGMDLSLKEVVFTDQAPGDEWPILFIIPESETDSADGLAAPDRRNVNPKYTIRAVSYGDDPAAKSRALAQLMGTLKQLLNTRKLREGKLPSGIQFNLAMATSIEFGKTQDDWNEASELTWGCSLVETGVF